MNAGCHWLRQCSGTRSGFTLVELLVVIAIIGLLVALLLPAVQQAREAGRRVQCTNNLKQIGIALANHIDVHGRFPVQIMMPYAQAGNDPLTGGAQNPFGPNWVVFLLPFLEQQKAFEDADPASYPGTNNLADLSSYDLSWRKVRSLNLPGFRCPTDSGSEAPFNDPNGNPPEANWARGNYASSSGSADIDHHIKGDNGVPNPPYPNQLSKGPVMAIDFGARPKDIVDGLAFTFAVHEVRVGVSPADRRGVWAMGFPGASVVCAGRDSNPTPNNHLDNADEIQGCDNFWYAGIGSKDQMGCRTGDTWGMAAQARSRHPGGVNACFCDGHVQFIADTITQRTWVLLQSTNDRQVLGNDY